MRKKHSMRAGASINLMKLTKNQKKAALEALMIVKYYNHNPDMGCTCDICKAVRVAKRHLELDEPHEKRALSEGWSKYEINK